MNTRRGSNWLVTPDKFLTPAEVRVLRGHLDGERRSGDRLSARNAAIVETLLGTGLRVSELCALAMGDLFLDRGAGSVLVKRGKGGKARLVAIGDALVDYLADFVAWKAAVREAINPGAPVFLSERGGALTRSAVHRIWKAALEGAGLPTRWGVHATRHSYAVEMYRKTKDLRLTQRQLGHSSPAVTQVYANLLDDDVRRGVAMVWSERRLPRAPARATV